MRALLLVLSLAVAACSSVPALSEPDAGCDPSCHWDCFGGSSCISGRAWIYGGGPRECCHYGDPWPDPGAPVCGAWSYACSTAACATPDPRYQACLDGLNRTIECYGDCEQLRLYCAVEGAPKVAGDACATDLDCRPAAEGVTRLRCDQQRCVDDVRPAPPADYGADCGLGQDDPSFVGEEAVSTMSATCQVCQIARTAAGACLRQACTMRCTYDEDCPSGSICLCSADGYVGNYCAAATDRTTPAGRAAGLPACP